jgi:hypothetical protein
MPRDRKHPAPRSLQTGLPSARRGETRCTFFRETSWPRVRHNRRFWT